MLPEVAVMVAVPPLSPVTTPLSLTVAMVGADEDQVASVNAAEVPLLYCAVAARVTVEPTVTEAGSG